MGKDPGQSSLTGQQEVVINYLKRGRTLTNKVALTCLGVGSLSSRIAELRRLGYPIVDSYEEDQLTGRLFKKYNLGEPTDSPNVEGDSEHGAA